MVSPRGEPPSPHRLRKKAFGLRVNGAEALYLGDREIRVHAAAGRTKTHPHALARREDPVADDR